MMKSAVRVVSRGVAVHALKGIHFGCGRPIHHMSSYTMALRPSTAMKMLQEQRRYITTPVKTDIDKHDASRRQKLDDHFSKALYGDVAAHQRLQQAADIGDHHAEAYLSILYWIGNTIIAADRQTAEMYAKRSWDWVKSEASNGCPYAQVALGHCLEHGKGVEKDEQEAFKQYSAAAKQNYTHAFTSLGSCYKEGVGVAPDEHESMRHYKVAADRGDISAQVNLAFCYMTAGMEGDAVKYLELAAEQGAATAQYCLGSCYEWGNGVARNTQTAARYYKQAADQGEPYALAILGAHHMNGTLCLNQDEATAVRYFMQSADNGYAVAQNIMGVRCESGAGVPKNEQEAVRYYSLAANQGDASGHFHLGRCYMDGIGVPKDETEAIRLCKIAADQQDPMALNMLGVCYSKGTGVEEDLQLAYEYFTLGAAQPGNGTALWNLGQCYEHGKGVAQDMQKAMKYYNQAAQLGEEPAIERLKALEGKVPVP